MAEWVVGALLTGVLVVLLVVCLAPARGLVQASAGLVGVGVVVTTSSLSSDEFRASLDRVLPVVLFLCASLVVAEACRAEGIFDALGGLIHDRAGTSGRRLVTLGFLLAAAVTVVLSLDATVVLLTPVLIVAGGAGQVRRPLAYLCVRLANSASLLLPVSNLTNLLALPRVDLSFLGWIVAMAPVWGAVLVVEYAGMRWAFRREIAAPVVATDAGVRPLRRVPLVVLGLMLVGFAGASPLGVEPWVVAIAAAGALVVLARRDLCWTKAVQAAQLPFGVFVLCLAVVVAALGEAYLTDVVGHLVPDSTGFSAGFWALLGIAVLATALANLVNNLPATLVVLPLVAPLGATAVFAALIGLNVGAGLTYPGSLANLLWRRAVVHAGESPRGFHAYALVVTPVALLAGVVALALCGDGILVLLHGST
ncbi:MAG: arsenic transporter [Nocardioidaceae bacterium]